MNELKMKAASEIADKIVQEIINLDPDVKGFITLMITERIHKDYSMRREEVSNVLEALKVDYGKFIQFSKSNAK